MTIWQVLHSVYGEFNPDITQLFITANPQIKDLKYVQAGTVLKVPSMPEKARPLKQDTIIVSLEKSKDLETTFYSFVEKYDLKYRPATLFLSFWNQREGKQFAIVLDKRFTSMEEAGEAIRQLPSELAVIARILSKWDGDIVFFNSRFLL